MDENKVRFSDYNFVKIEYKFGLIFLMHLMFRDDLKVWTAIHSTIDACATISERCKPHFGYKGGYK